eukprot:COSAG02_NODE_36192_length_458_cov_0.487465_1_plen_59_part_10
MAGWLHPAAGDKTQCETEYADQRVRIIVTRFAFAHNRVLVSACVRAGASLTQKHTHFRT